LRQIFLKPAAGLRVPDPATGEPLPATGARVTPSAYWSRRLADADVQTATPPKPHKGPKA
jgi:hypothetical protein